MGVLSLFIHFLPILGIIGYFCDIEWLIWVGGIIAIILYFSMEIYSKKPKILSLYVIFTVIIGIIYSVNADVPWWFAIITVCSFTYITLQIISLIILIFFAESNRNESGENNPHLFNK